MKFKFNLVLATLATLFVNESFSKSIKTDYYNKKDIKQTTGWKNVSIRKNADLHLSLLSQGKYNEELVNQYDNNYYYPSSAGKDIDIVIVDSGFNFRHPEFSNKNERTTKCVAKFVDGQRDYNITAEYCGTDNPGFISTNEYHGEWVSDVAAGLKHGVAPKANVYGVSADASFSGFITAVEYVADHLIRRHKTVVSLSLGQFFPIEGESEERDRWIKVIKNITQKGAIVVAAAHNFGEDTYNIEKNKQMLPCVLDNVICVGGTDTIEGLEVSDKEFFLEIKLEALRLRGYDPELIAKIAEQYNSLNLEEMEDIIHNTIIEVKKAEREDKIIYDNIKFGILNKKFENLMKSSNTTITYKLGEWSDYGRDVDIYGPGLFYAEYQNINSENVDVYNHGTSFATPIVSGVIATIMSEHPHVKFTPKTMLDYLNKTGLKNIVSGVPEGYPNVFINNGKQLVYSSDNKYHGCGIQAGNQQCPRHQCCSSEGKCTKDKKVCANGHKNLIKNY